MIDTDAIMGSRRVGSSMSNSSYDFNEYEGNTPLVPIEPFLPTSEVEHTVQWELDNADHAYLIEPANSNGTKKVEGFPDGISTKNVKSRLPDLDGLCYIDYR